MRDRNPRSSRSTRSRLRLVLAAAAAALPGVTGIGGPALGQEAPANAVTTLPTVEVIAVSPVLGSGIDPDKVPANLRILSDRDLGGEGLPDLTGTLQRRVSSVTLTDVEGNPFQPDVQ